MRVSLPGYDAGTDTNLDHYALYADADNILIKENTRGTIGVADGYRGTITHDFNYIPFFMAYGADGTKKRWIYGDTIYSTLGAYTTTTKIYLTNDSGGTTIFNYYLFYDQQG